MIRFHNAAEAAAVVQTGERVFVHGSSATPRSLLLALLARGGAVTKVEIVAISLLGKLDWNKPEVTDHFFMNSLFVSENIRGWVAQRSGDYVPVFLSEIPALFRSGTLPIDVAFLQLSPPDVHGYCSLGTSVDAALAAAQCAKKVVAQINPRMPRTLGDSHIHVSRIWGSFEEASELAEVQYAAGADIASAKIGELVAGLIEDGSTLQMGIGAIPDAVLQFLGDHKNLGIHTEMFSDGVIALVERGVINNANKKVERGKIVAAFVLGSRRLYDFVDDNPFVSFRDVSWVNDTSVIRKNARVVAINSALEIDLTGQVCADSIGIYQYSGIGGQMDFMRGAALSQGGKPIIAMPSTTQKGISRIAPMLNPGGGVVTTRGHVHYVVTEHGCVNLYGKALQERARLLTSIAAPEHRETLERATRDRFGN